MRNNYWRCSKFADFIRGSKTLHALSGKEWKEWHQKEKTIHPFRYWLAEEALGSIQNFINWPLDKYHNIKWYLNNRFISQSHQLTASAKHIKRGQWCDITERILPCLFDTLVDYVEIELAHIQCWNNRKYKWKNGRCQKAGRDNLYWQESLVYNEDSGVYPGDKLYGKLTKQAINAKEIHDLYVWWTEIYSNRLEPMDESGWSEFCSRKRTSGDGFMDFLDADETTEHRKESKRILSKLNKLEKKYHNEDTNMMIRLIKVRDSLWT